METPAFGSRKRSYVIAGIFLAMICFLLYRLYVLQFVDYETFRSKAERISIRRLSHDPLRGLIYDRDTNIIVDNNPSYTLTITPFEFHWDILPLLDRYFGIDTNLVRYRIVKAGINSFEPVKIANDLSFAQLSIIEENHDRLPGIGYIVESRRRYLMKPNMSHLLGYTREISPRLLKSLGPYYQPGDIVGYNGIEAYFEPELRGRKGYGFLTVNSRGRVVESFEHGRSDIPAIEGADLILTLDLKLQRYVERLMRYRRGAVVAMNPNNGEILAFVSSPDYNLREVSGKISIDAWKKLNTNPGYPFYNRCSMAAYPPGSTFKMMLAAAALQEGIIDKNTTIHCPGSYTLAGVNFKCHGAHGNVRVVRAIEHSCNVFFYKLIFKLGFDLWSKYGSMMHFGRKTGMDISNENPGTLPSKEYYNRRYGDRWNMGYLVSLGIGQGEVNTTPLQMAAYTATIANMGTYYRPHAVRSTIDRNAGGITEVPVQGERLPIDQAIWEIVRYGMYRAVNGNGTGYSAAVSGARVCGKTGTAQNPHGRDHAWFVGFAPYENPEIAVAVIIENGGFGGKAAAPVAGSVIRYHLYGGYSPASSDTTAATEGASDVQAQGPAGTQEF